MDQTGSGLGWLDYDQDGLMDLFLVQGAAFQPPYAKPAPTCKLFKNLGNGRFEELALTAANAKNLGVIAMKVTGQEFLVGDGPGKAEMGSLLRYSMSLPVATAVVGMPRPEMLARNVATARNFSPLNDQEKESLRQQLKPAREGMEKRLVGHLDGPTANPEMFLA